MKKVIYLLVSIIVCLTLLSCSNSSSTSGSNNSLIIKGTFNSLAKNSFIDRFLLWFSNKANALDVSEVAKVIVFSGNYQDYYVKNVSNGSFEVDVDRGKPYGIIFANANDGFLGYVTFNNGINSLPTSVIDESHTVVDLGTLTVNNTVYTPQNNPIGTFIQLSTDEIDALAQCNSFFSAVVQNPDTDGDGKIDILSGSYYILRVMYFITPSNTWVQNGNVLEPNLVQNNIYIHGYNLVLFVNDNNGVQNLSNVAFTGPNGFNNSTAYQMVTFNNNNTQAGYWSVLVGGTLPIDGLYTIHYGNKTLNFTIPDQSGATDNIILMVPSVTLNGNGTIHKINWIYRTPGSAGTIDPKLIIDTWMIQIYGYGPQCQYDPQHSDQIYQTTMTSDCTITEHTLTCQDILWSNVTGIGFAYNDKYGNHYVVSYNKN